MIRQASYLPDFTPELVNVLRDGSRKAVAAELNNFVKEIVEDMAKYEGSGNTKYYEACVADGYI